MSASCSIIATSSPSNHFRSQVATWPAELGRFGRLTLFLALRDIRGRYRQSILGLAWAVLVPVLMAAVLTLTLGSGIMKGGLGEGANAIASDLPYPLFALLGLVPWLFFASCVNSCLGSLVANRSLVTKVRFPQEALPASCILAHAVDFGVSVMVVAAYAQWCIIRGKWEPVEPGGLIWIPVILFSQLCWTFGIGLVVASTYLFYRDVKPIVVIGLQLGLFVSGVILPPQDLAGFSRILELNPMLHLIMGYRNVLAGADARTSMGLLLSLGLSPLFLVFSWVWFRRASWRFAEAA